MKRQVGLPCLIVVLLMQLVHASAGPPISADSAFPPHASPPVTAQPALGLSDLAIAEPQDASTWALPPDYLFAVSSSAQVPALIPDGPLPSLAQSRVDLAAEDIRESGLPGGLKMHTYFVPFDDENLWKLFIGKAQCHGANHYPCAPLVSKVFVTAGADRTQYYYDHYEDGYDADPLKPKATTEVGLLDAGATKLFAGDIEIAPDGSVVTSTFPYGGRDRITIVGEDANVVRWANPSGYATNGNCEPLPANTSGWLAAAWEVLEVSDWGTAYHATVGEDLGYAGVGNPGSDDDHDYAGLEIMTWQDNTTVYYTGRLSETLQAGETYFVPGQGSWVVGETGVYSTDNITATKPIQVQMVTGACGRDIRELVSAHGYTLVPARSWSNAYWAPVPGFVGNPNAPRDIDTDIYLHNPDPDTAISVAVTSGLSQTLLPITPDTTISVLRETGWGDLAAGNQGTYFSSEGMFWGVAVIDSSTARDGAGDDWDWGYSLVPASKLSSQLVVGYAPGKPDVGPDGNPTDNGSLAFVVAASDTRIYVDLDHDGLPDPFDMDGDGQLGGTDLWGEERWDECASGAGIPVQRGQVLRVGDPVDRNLEGARIYTGGLREHIAAAWGQDANRTDDLDYLDLGYTLLPLSVPRLSKTDGRATDVDGDSVGYVPGDTITYTIVLDNNGMGSMSAVVLTDTLPLPAYSDFIVGSLEITTPPPTDTVEYHNDAGWDTAPGSDADMIRITWDNLEPQQRVTITLNVGVHTAIAPTDEIELCNHVVVSSLSTDPVTDTICGPVLGPLLGIDKTVVPDLVQPGERITYTVVVSNYGNDMAWPTVISDVLPPGVQYVSGTLDLRWPVARVETVTETTVLSSSFRGTYADDFDLGDREGTTNYGGDDGALKWTTPWSEINDEGTPANGAVQVRVDENLALSEPAFVRLSAGAGLTRTLDLSEFYSPVLRYYLSATLGTSPDNAYHVTATLGHVLPPDVIGAAPSIPYSGGYCVQELDLSAFAGVPEVTLGLMASGGMAEGTAYHLDNVSVHERDPKRDDVEREVPKTVTTIEYRSALGTDPLWYTDTTPSHQMVFTDGLQLPPGTVLTATFQARIADAVDIPLGGSLWLTNTAWVTATNWLEGPARADALIYLQRPPIDKSVEPDGQVESGSVLTYTLTYINEGEEDLQRVFITDTLPLPVTFGGIVTQSAGWSVPPFQAPGPPPAYDPGPPATLTWYTPTLAAGATGQFVYTVTVSPDYVGTISNTACISAAMSGGAEVYDCDTTWRDIVKMVDLEISKSDDPDPVVPGELLTYTLAYTNSSLNMAENVVVTDVLPAGTTFVQANPAPDSAADPLTWNVGQLAGGESRTIVVTVQVGAQVTQPLTNTAYVSTTTLERDYENNRAMERTDVWVADVAISKAADPPLPDRVGQAGRQLVYTLDYANLGPAPAENVVVTDLLPSEVEAVLAVSRPALGTDPLVWNLGTLNAGEGGTILVTVTLRASAGPMLTNPVEIATDTRESDLSNNQDDVDSEVQTDLAIDKGHTPDDPPNGPGEPLTYTYVITYANLGEFDGQEVYITDTLPVDVTFQEVVSSTPGWTFTEVISPDLGRAEKLVWNRPRLAAGAMGWITYTVLVNEPIDWPDPQEIWLTNTVRIANDIWDYDLNNNDDAATTAVQLLYFDTLRLPHGVLLKWATAWETDSYGFVLLRSAGGRLQDAREIAFVPAAGSGGGGAAYRYLDEGLERDTPYTYWLVEVDTRGRRTTFGSALAAAGSELPYRVYLPFSWRP